MSEEENYKINKRMSYRGDHNYLLTNTEFTDYQGVNFNKYSLEELKRLWRETLENGMHGLCFSMYEDGQEPGDVITEAQVKRRMKIMKPYYQMGSFIFMY